MRISGSFVAIVLAMALLGPAPGRSDRRRLAPIVDACVVPALLGSRDLTNVVDYAIFPIVGAVC